MKKLLTGLFAIAAFTFSVNAQTQNNDNDQKSWNKNDQSGDHRGRGDRGMMGMQNLNLTDAQKQQMKSINEDFKSKMDQLKNSSSQKDVQAQRDALMQDRKDKISAILTPEQKTQFAQMGSQGRGNRNGGMNGDNRMNRNGGDRMMQMKTDLGLSDDQLAKMKTSNENFSQKMKSIRDNQSLSDQQKQDQLSALRAERAQSLKTILTPDQLAKMQQMKGNGDWKEKMKNKDGKEKMKSKTT